VPEQRHYRPAWFLQLRVRLEDFGAADDSTDQSSDVPYDTKAKAIDAQIAQNEQALANESVFGALSVATKMDVTASAIRSQNRTLVAQKARLPRGAATDGPKGDEFSIEFVTVPSELEIEDRGFREAAVLTATFPFCDMPIDPRIIRECEVQGYMGTVNATEFGEPDTWHLKASPSKTCIRRFKGYVDMPEMSMSEADSTIHIKARSYEATLIDGKINAHAPAYRIEGEEEFLTTYINRILSQYPPTSGDAGGDPFQAVWFAADPATEPKLGRKDLLRSLQTAKSRNQANKDPGVDGQKRQSENVDTPTDVAGTGDSAEGGEASMPPKSVTPDGMSIWDLITQACELCGCMPIYQPALDSSCDIEEDADRPTGSQNGGKDIVVFGGSYSFANYLLLTPPQCFLDDITDDHIRVKGGSRDRFHRDFKDGDKPAWTSDVRFMVWGHNVKLMKTSRKMGRTRPTAVEVRAYNPDADASLRVMKARFPSTKADIHAAGQGTGKAKGKARKQTAKGKGKVDIVRTFVLQGVRTVKQLEDAAVAIYHQLTRAELSIELETDDLSSYMDATASLEQGQLVVDENGDPDIMRLCAGTPVRVTVASQKDDNLIISTLSDFYGSGVNNVEKLIRQQQAKWGTWLGDNSAQIDTMVQKIQRAYNAAKIPDIFYVRSIKTKCSGEEGQGFSATMELVNYMPDNDPAGMSIEDRDMNDRRKLKKRGTKAVKKDRAAARTEGLKEGAAALAAKERQ
jgi:hypothetical protein